MYTYFQATLLQTHCKIAEISVESNMKSIFNQPYKVYKVDHAAKFL